MYIPNFKNLSISRNKIKVSNIVHNISKGLVFEGRKKDKRKSQNSNKFDGVKNLR